MALQEPIDNSRKQKFIKLRLMDRMRDDEYRIIKSYVRRSRSDLDVIDIYTAERILAMGSFRSIPIHERAKLIRLATEVLYPYGANQY